MNSLDENPELREQASAWFFRMRRTDVTDQDRVAFQAWLASSHAHEQAYAHIERVWRADNLASALRQLPVSLPVPLATPPTSPTPWPRRRHVYKTLRPWAAAACLLLALGWLAESQHWLDAWQADYRTTTGEQTRLTLADGSEVLLNTDTALQVLEGQPRAVRLLHGQAYFHVQTDPAHPFTVATDHGLVTVLGTRFTVRTAGDTEVDLESGLVQCANQQGEQRQLVPGQHANIAADKPIILAHADPDTAFGWTQGRLIFQDRPLAEVLAELERYHPGLVVLARQALADQRVSGNYRLDDTLTILRELTRIVHAELVTVTPLLTLIR